MHWLKLNVSLKQFFKDLYGEMNDDEIFNGAAALAFYEVLAVFPAMLFLLSLLPYLPLGNIDVAILNMLKQALPDEAAKMFTGVIEEITKNRKGGLLSFGLLMAFYASTSGTLAMMQQLNNSYDVKEGRSFFKVRAVGLGLTIFSGVVVVLAFGLIVLGGQIQEWLAVPLGHSPALLTIFAVIRWLIIVAAMMFWFAIVYYFGPDVEQKFKFITPGSILGTLLAIAASLGFRAYVTNFGNYGATYGSIGAVIIFMLWLYVMGLVLLLGSEINALIEHYSPEGKSKGEKEEPAPLKLVL